MYQMLFKMNATCCVVRVFIGRHMHSFFSVTSKSPDLAQYAEIEAQY